MEDVVVVGAAGIGGIDLAGRSKKYCAKSRHAPPIMPIVPFTFLNGTG
jgi:hypothetical protein